MGKGKRYRNKEEEILPWVRKEPSKKGDIYAKTTS